MRLRRAAGALPLTLVAIALLGACGGDDEDSTSTSPAPATTGPPPAAAPNGGTAPPGASGLPPELVQCFENKGIEVRSPGEIHSAPPAVVQECFSALHGGDGP